MTSPHDFDSHSMLPPEDEVEFLDYIAVLVRRRWLIFWTTTLCILAAVGFVLRRQVEVFTAEAIILPAKAREYLNLDGIQQHPSRHSFYLDILQSPAISRRVLEKEYEYVLNGQPGKGNLLDYFGVASMHKGFDALAGISDFASERTGVITITIETLAPRLSAAVANEYVAQLRAYNQRTRRASLDSQLVFINGRLAEIWGELDSLQRELVTFQRRNRDVVSKEGLSRATESSLEFERRRNEIEIHSSLYSTVLNKHEIARIEAKQELADFQVLAMAQPPEFGNKTSLMRAAKISLGVGLMLSIFLAFIVEYIARNRASGRMDPILAELRKDTDRLRRLFGGR